MKPLGEPNMRKRLDPEVAAAAQRAGQFPGPWHVDYRGHVRDSEREVICDGNDPPALAQHICDAHNHFLNLYNALLFRERSEEDLHEPGRTARQIPATAGSRRFPVPPSRPRSAGTP